jgi:ABC-type glycerol-3-phosphate transport system substrate-binding protein
MTALFRFIRGYFPLIVVASTFLWSAAAIVNYRAAHVPQGAIVLRLGHWQLESSVRQAIDAMAKEYREKINPNVYIVQDAIPEGTYGQWVSTQLMGGTAPDILQVGSMLPGNIWLSYYQRFFVPLGKYVERPNPHNTDTEHAGIPLRKTYKDGMKTAYVDEMQEYMSIPLSQFGSRVFYNRDLLRKLTGLEEPPDEYRAFMQVCETIRSQTNELGKFYIPVAGSGYHFGMMGGLMWESLTYLATTKADFNRDGSVGGDEQFVAFRTGRLDFDFLRLPRALQDDRGDEQEFPIRLHRADPRRGGVPVRPAESGVHVHRHLGRAQFAGAGQGPV